MREFAVVAVTSTALVASHSRLLHEAVEPWQTVAALSHVKVKRVLRGGVDQLSPPSRLHEEDTL